MNFNRLDNELQDVITRNLLSLHFFLDECEHSDCAQVCSTCNRESYICSCNTGYTLDAGGRACNGECMLTVMHTNSTSQVEWSLSVQLCKSHY